MWHPKLNTAFHMRACWCRVGEKNWTHHECCIPIYIPQNDIWLFHFISNLPRTFEFYSWSSIPVAPLKFSSFANILNTVAMLLFRLLMKTDPDRWHSAALFQCSETCCFMVRKLWKYDFLFKSLSMHVLVLLFAMELPTAGLHFLHPKNFIEIQCIYVWSLAFALQSWQVFSICLFLRTEQIPSREIATKVKEWRDLLEETWKLPVKTNVCLGNLFKAMNKQLTL